MTAVRAGATDALREALREHGGTLARLVAAVPDDGERLPAPAADGRGGGENPARLAASGPRTEGHAAEYELLVDLIREGSLVHYGPPRVIATDDADLGLLVGDQLYALGLSRLAALGDLDAVIALAGVIADVARAHAAHEPGAVAPAWARGARRVGWGTSARPCNARSEVDDQVNSRASSEEPRQLVQENVNGQR